MWFPGRVYQTRCPGKFVGFKATCSHRTRVAVKWIAFFKKNIIWSDVCCRQSGDAYENTFVSFRLLCDAVIIPRFPEPVNNVTVVAGRDAVLSCSVDNLHKFKVSHWRPKEGITSKLGLSQIWLLSDVSYQTGISLMSQEAARIDL